MRLVAIPRCKAHFAARTVLKEIKRERAEQLERMIQGEMQSRNIPCFWRRNTRAEAEESIHSGPFPETIMVRCWRGKQEQCAREVLQNPVIEHRVIMTEDQYEAIEKHLPPDLPPEGTIYS